MGKITINANARALANKTGINKLGQDKLAKLDRNGDGKVTLSDVRKLASEAGLDKDGVLSRDDRKAIAQVLGLSTGRGGGGEAARGGGGEAGRGGGGERGGVYRGSDRFALRGGGGERPVIRRGGGGESSSSVGGGGGGGGE